MSDSTIDTDEELDGDEKIIPNPLLGFPSYSDGFLRIKLGKVKFIPMEMASSKCLIFNIQGLDTPYKYDDTGFHNGLSLMGAILTQVRKLYAKTHLFDQPILIWKPEPMVFELKIGILEKERFKAIMQARKKKKKNG